MTDLFNALTDLVEDVSRFFLIDCGDPAGQAKKCTPKDRTTQSESGHKAIEDSDTVKRVVDAKIASQLK